MAYKRITKMEIKEILRRMKDKQTISQISEVMGLDRKTVRKYLNQINRSKLKQEESEEKNEQVSSSSSNQKDISETQAEREKEKREMETILREIRIEKDYPQKKRKIFEPYIEEIKELMNKNRLKVKTSFEVIEERHGLKGKSSINTFRRFVRDKGIKESKPQITCRIEVAPGEEVQIDYCKVGKARDKESGKDRSVYAFMGNLSHSRNKYVEYVYKQDTRSFVSSHVKMFKYFGGVPKRILIDNLTSGIIKADLYDPRLNHSYQEMAEHYGVFIDPCRVRHPKDKGKVERDVQTVREQYRKMQALNSDIDIQEANQIMVRYLKEEYGQREHGTTRLKPYEVFKNVEQPALKKLPNEDFEIAEWKEAGVHPDCYIQFNKRAYSVPYTYAGKKVWVKGTEKLIQIYNNGIMIKQHTITSNYRSTDFADFPKNVSAALDSGFQKHLITKSEKIGTNFHKMILNTLTPHAFMNLRRAQGIVGLSEKYDSEVIEKASEIALIQNRYVTPKSFKVIVDKLIEQNGGSETIVQLSDESKSYVRQVDYFIHNNIFNMES